MEGQAHPGKLAFGQDRFDRPTHFLNGRFDCKVSAHDTDGALCIIDTVRDAIGGPPLHYHEAQDEWFMVLEGEFLFQVSDKLHRAGPGDSVFGPRKVAHTFRCLTTPARLLLVFQPAFEIEAFFSSGVSLGQAQTEMFDALSLKHRIHNIGPPLKPEQADF